MEAMGAFWRLPEESQRSFLSSQARKDISREELLKELSVKKLILALRILNSHSPLAKAWLSELCRQSK